jgi:hypothetical protein
VKRILANAAGLAAVAVAVVAIAELTQSRPDIVERGTVTEVRFDVATRRARQREDDAAAALWEVCAHTTVGTKRASDARPVEEGYVGELRPAIGEHGRRRLVGCLEDATVDRVLGRVLSIRGRTETRAAAASRGSD